MIFLLRHAESLWNREFSAWRVDPGLPDPPLTEVGRRQAAALAERLRRERPRRVLVSPYRRSIETGLVLAEVCGAELAVEPLLRERCAFSCDIGTPASELRRQYPGLALDGLPEVWWGGLVESDSSLERRCRELLRSLHRHEAGRVLVLVSHWGFVRALTGHRLDNAGMLCTDWQSLERGEWWSA
ncbi:Phosphoserine phosphatase 1 [bacterium HR40]|nr:Phosphoserine phosphatase 1 [bacterium HR40]